MIQSQAASDVAVKKATNMVLYLYCSLVQTILLQTQLISGITSSAMSSKKRKCLFLSEKVAVIQFAKANPNFGARKIAQNFEIGRTQVQTILQKKKSLQTSFETLDGPQTNIKRFRTGKFDAVNKALREWYMQLL